MNFDENLADFGCGLEEESSMSKNAASFLKSYARTSAVLNAIETVDATKKREIIREYLDFCYGAKEGKVRRSINPISIVLSKPEFESITREDLPDIQRDSRSTIIVVEFFTHCCINCIHSIEDVREVHEEIDRMFDSDGGNGFRGVKVVSIHSPKFPREKDLESIKAFCKRMKMDHSEVVNDPKCVLWNDLGVTCWPTLMVLGPSPDGSGPNLLFTLMGEGHKDDLMTILKTAVDYFKSSHSQDVDHQNGFAAKKFNELETSKDTPVAEHRHFLRFPGKVAVYGEQLIISDSGNNRLVVANMDGNVTEIIGGSRKGCKDGNFKDAQFYNPQGIAFRTDHEFYLADTGNHMIRKVDLKSKLVSTLIDVDRVVQVNEESVVMKSPWDLTFYDFNTLIIAAAGNHRLFGYFFEDTDLFGTIHLQNSFAVIAGSGREENRNNSYILKASFAQPSGIAVNVGGEKCIYIADSESSSVRSISLKGQVIGIVGGSRDPTDLFAFGDIDGKGFNVKLQHPMGVCCGKSSEIFIADTYNHKIKRIDVTTKECQTVVSTGLNEPSGICLSQVQDLLYVADTNHHSIKLIDLKDWSMCEMELKLSAAVDQKNELKFDKEFQVIKGNGIMQLNFVLSPLPEEYEGGQWKVILGDSVEVDQEKGDIEVGNGSSSGNFTITILQSGARSEFTVVVDVFFCGPSSCLKRTRKIKVTCVSNATTNGAEDLGKSMNLVWNGLTWKI